MAVQGMKILPEVIMVYNEIKTHHKEKFAIFRIDKGRCIVDVDQNNRPGPSATLDDFLKLCKPDDVFYAVFDADGKLANGKDVKRLGFIFWVPDTAHIGLRMLYNSNKDSVKGKCGGLHFEIKAETKDDIHKGIKQAFKKT